MRRQNKNCQKELKKVRERKKEKDAVYQKKIWWKDLSKKVAGISAPESNEEQSARKTENTDKAQHEYNARTVEKGNRGG